MLARMKGGMALRGVGCPLSVRAPGLLRVGGGVTPWGNLRAPFSSSAAAMPVLEHTEKAAAAPAAAPAAAVPAPTEQGPVPTRPATAAVHNLYFGNLSWTAGRPELLELLRPYEPIASINLMRDRETSRSLGYAFVEVEQGRAAELVARLNGGQFMGRELRVRVGGWVGAFACLGLGVQIPLPLRALIHPLPPALPESQVRCRALEEGQGN
jgi:hypothetical protein